MKTFLFGGIFVLVVAIMTVFSVKTASGSQSSKLSLLNLANINALANGESGSTGSRTPAYSWTSNEETHWEGGCIVITYNSHIGCLNINSDNCSSGVTKIRNMDCP